MDHHLADIGIIGGSGLYTMPGFSVEQELALDTPWGSPSDHFMLGSLANRKVAFLARHGRGHKISPSELNFRANIYGMKKLGVSRILSLSAVGSLKEEHKPLEFVIPDQFFDRTRGRVSSFFGDGLVAHISFADPICPQLAAPCPPAVPIPQHPLQTRWNLPLYGRPRLLNQSRIECLPQLGHGRHRHDQSAGSQARP